MFGSKPASRSTTSKRDGEFRYATRHLALERGKRVHQAKESAPLKACERLLKSDGWKSPKYPLQKSNGKKSNQNKNSSLKDVKNKHPFQNHHEKVVIVSKRSSSVSVVKSCNMQRSVSVKKVSYSTSVFLSSDEDESDSDEADEDEEKRKVYSRTRSTVLKRTTSKVKAKYSSKKPDNRSSKKSNALKLLREKAVPSIKKKATIPSRELRPRFPYSATQEWPTARAHRMASLNALAKVHILYENEGRSPGENGNECEDNCLLDLLEQEKKFINESKAMSKEFKSSSTLKEKKDKSINDKSKTGNSVVSKKIVDTKSKIKRLKKRKPPCDVEIIDTKMCKRMACLNAQAILAASYLQEKPKREKIVRKVEKSPVSPKSDVDIKEIIDFESCNVEIIETGKQHSPQKVGPCLKENQNEIIIEDVDHITKNNAGKNKGQEFVTKTVQSREQEKALSGVVITENRQCISASSENSSTMATTAVSEVGVTKYTEVTKVQINTTKEMEIKEEGKAERKIERILEKDDVAITRMYHYQSNNASQSYCLQMQTTYKPASRNFTPPPVNQRPSGQNAPHVMGAVMPSRQSYYNYPNRSPVLASQSYPINRNISGMQPIMGMDHVARQYGGSAFTVPHYGHPSPVSYSHNDYGYYQPAGPLIQPVNDQCMIHKPVPYHPQPHPQIHQPRGPAPPSAATASNHDRYSSVDSHFPHPPVPGAAAIPSKQNVTIHRNQPPLEMASSPTRSSHLHPNEHQNLDHTAPNHGNIMHLQNSRPQQLPPVQTQKNYPAHDNPDNYQCRSMNSQNYPSSQEPPTYSSNRYHNYSSGYVASQHNIPAVCASINQSQMPPGETGTCRDSNRTDTTHLVSMSLPVAMEAFSNASIPKSEPSMSDGKLPLQHDKWDLRYESAQFKDSSKGHSNVESRSQRRDKNRFFPRPPSVVEVVDECDSRDTKTYIELDVPKACPQEKIIVVDVERDEKGITVQHSINACGKSRTEAYHPPHSKLVMPLEITEVNNVKKQITDCPKDKINSTQSHNSCNTKDMPTKCSINRCEPTRTDEFHAPYSKLILQPEVIEINDVQKQQNVDCPNNENNTQSNNSCGTILPAKHSVKKCEISRPNEYHSTHSQLIMQPEIIEVNYVGKQNADCPNDKINNTQLNSCSTKDLPTKRSIKKREISRTDEYHSPHSKLIMQPEIIEVNDVEKQDADCPNDQINSTQSNKSCSTEDILTKRLIKKCKNSRTDEYHSLHSKLIMQPLIIEVNDVEKPDTDFPNNKISNTQSNSSCSTTDMLTKCLVVKCENSRIAEYHSPLSKHIVQPEIIEVNDVEKQNTDGPNNIQSMNSSSTTDMPDVMVIEVTKKKETSALIRRAKLHGKQRTFRDSENRPLVPYSKAKKEITPLNSLHHQKSIFQPMVSLPRLVLPKKVETTFSHGWCWEGESSEKLVYISNDDPPFLRQCYPSMRHVEGDVIHVRDCVLLKSGIRKTDLPFVAKITALWENPIDGEMTMSLLWYYRPEHTEFGRKSHHMEDEIFASKHRDTNSVACIEDKCYVLTFGEYCRYRRQSRMLENSSQPFVFLVPQTEDYPRKARLPPGCVSSEMVFFCRKVYDFRQKRILKNPV